MDSLKKHRLLYRAKEAFSCYSFIIIPVGLLALFCYLPVMWAFSKSLYEYEIGDQPRFVGLSHYIEFFTKDPTTWVSLLNMLFLTTFAVFMRLCTPLLVAKFIHSLPKEKWRYLYRIVFLVPIVVPGVAGQLIWQGIYANRGMLNELLRLVGLGGWCRGWLTDPDTALTALAFVGFPFVGGFEVLIYYAGLSNIPTSVNEACKLEGCTGVKKFFLIDIPMVMSQLKLIAILVIIAGVQSFENVFILTQGMPGFKTMVPGLWMYYNAFSFQRFGYACAIGVVLFFIIFVLTVLNFKYFKSTEEATSA